MAERLLDIIGTILLFLGMSLAFLPHALHIRAGFDSEASHLNHVISGLALLAIGLAILIYNNKALKIRKSARG